MQPNNTPGAMPGQPKPLETQTNKTTDASACRRRVGGCTAGPTPYEGSGTVQLDNTPKASSVYTQAADLLAALFRNAPDAQLLGLRIITRDGPVVDQQYHRIGGLKANGFDTAIPTHYDGGANLYLGVVTRTRREGTGDAAGAAPAIWFDEFTRPAPDLPPLSWIVETPPGKHQGGYFLAEPINDLRRVELLNQRLGLAVGGDTVWDRARILRLPGFLNVKKEHPEHPRAFLLELNPDLRYSLEELEAALPPLAAGEQEYTYKEHTGPFPPTMARHWLATTRNG